MVGLIPLFLPTVPVAAASGTGAVAAHV